MNDRYSVRYRNTRLLLPTYMYVANVLVCRYLGRYVCVYVFEYVKYRALKNFSKSKRVEKENPIRRKRNTER